jgi:hypothetical protein
MGGHADLPRSVEDATQAHRARIAPANSDGHADQRASLCAAKRVRSGCEVWTIPGDRMKSERELRVPLCDEAVELVRNQIATGA